MKKVVMLLLVFLFSLGQSFAQVVYDRSNGFFTRTIGDSTDWSISFELIIISVCLGFILYFAVFVSEDQTFYFGNQPSEKIKPSHLIPNLVVILTAIIYSNYVANSFYLEILITIGIIISMVSFSVNKYHVWNLSRYLAIQISSMIIALLIVFIITQSPLAIAMVSIPPLVAVLGILCTTDW